MIEIEEREDVTPLCPHCNEPTRSIQYRRLSGFLGKRYVYFCGLCPRSSGCRSGKGSGWGNVGRWRSTSCRC